MKNQTFKLQGDLKICEKELEAIEFHHNKVWEDIILNEQQGKSKKVRKWAKVIKLTISFTNAALRSSLRSSTPRRQSSTILRRSTPTFQRTPTRDF